MKITFLGTGTSQGVPVIGCDCKVCRSDNMKDKRLRSSVLIEVDGLNLVIDSGPDFRQQMLLYNVRKLDAILLTHQHKDHIAGMDDIRAYNYFQKKPMDVYGDVRVQEAIRREFAYVFAEHRYPGIPEMNLHLIDNKAFEIQGVEIIPILVKHKCLPVFAFRIKDFTYITDANFINDNEIEKIKGSKIIVVNALRKKQHISHYTLSEALQLLEELNPEQAYLTHISHQMGLYDELTKELPRNVRFAHDGLQITI